ncbi:MAG: hypothetical protein ABSG95_02015 [Solirubrobacteraceae bacterium]
MTAGAASAAVIFNSLPAREGNYASLGYEATSTAEFGGQVEFAAGSGRTSAVVSTRMSSWACQSLLAGTSCKTTPGATFNWPITLKVYKAEANNEPGEEVASVTEEVAVPYRPSANSHCPLTPEGVVGWGPKCYSGKAFTVRFTLNPLIKLPEPAIISVAYDTVNYGNAPCGTNVACTNREEKGEDSLNLALLEHPSASKGSIPLQNEEGPGVGWVYVNSTYPGIYAPLPTPSPIKFALAGEWTLQPMFKVTASRH